MAKDDKKATNPKYKAVNPDSFKENYNSNSPKYDELCKGESVSLNAKDKHTISWLSNNIIIKE